MKNALILAGTRIADRLWSRAYRRSVARQRMRDMGQGNDMDDRDDTPRVEGAFEVVNNAATVGTGKRVWRYTEPLWYVDVDDVTRCIPEGFSCDFRSSPRIVWGLWPPKDGKSDHAWGIHDFECRCYKLLGLTLKDVDGERFDAAMKHFGKSAAARWWHRKAVEIGNRRNPPLGDGLHRRRRYNTKVYHEPTGEWMGLREWLTTRSAA